MESIYRSLWRHYYEGQNALIFVIDAVNSERIDEAINELHMTLLHPSMQNVPLLILANTAGSKNAMSLDSIHEKLNLVLVSKSKWYGIVFTKLNLLKDSCLERFFFFDTFLGS
ncbi:hypothetical protein HMI56_000781 [Coelomomyces lativittatus]|nr:hypothetical protein HMI56_000781 [Coelomomyces lativittatus]